MMVSAYASSVITASGVKGSGAIVVTS